MIIFIGNLPPAARETDTCIFAGLPEGAQPRVYKKQDGNGGLHRYALIHPGSEREGRRLIRRLNGRTCDGHKLIAREYGHRSASNERRRLDWRELPWDGPERRKGERRVMGTQR